MYIRQIYIKTFRHLENVRLGPFSQPHSGSELIVLAGPNGGGKSSILELLGYALSNSWSLEWSLARSFPSNAFEIEIGLTHEERDLVSQYGRANSLPYFTPLVAEYLEKTGSYFRSYNLPDGEYQENSTLHDQIHSIVIEALRNHNQRPTGFFLKSDRHYSQRNFNQNSIFQFQQKTRRDYIQNMAFRTSDVQYADMYDFLVQQRYHYYRKLGAYYHKIAGGGAGSQTSGPPPDPLQQYDELLQQLFPEYSFTEGTEEMPQNLFVRIPSGEVIPFTDMSSGEREVFFILSFFLRHDVANAIIVIDEPEMHLHPELARLLVRTMQGIRPSNQIVLATHNAEIIDEAGRDRVTYVARDAASRKSVITAATDEAEAISKLRDLFGYSGYVGVARSIVFLEGLESSADRKTFANLFPSYGSKLKFVPAQSVENLPRLNSAVLSILESNLGWMKFFLIRDRDFLPDDVVAKYVNQSQGRLYVLGRYHIENYLLDDEAIARTLKDVFGLTRSSAQVSSLLKQIAIGMAGEVLRDMVAYRLNLIFRPEDFSLGSVFQGQQFWDTNNTWNQARLSQFSHLLKEKIGGINADLALKSSDTAIAALVAVCSSEIGESLQPGNSDWRRLFPGKEILARFSKHERLGKPVVLVNSVIKELGASPERVPSDLQAIMSAIVSES